MESVILYSCNDVVCQMCGREEMEEGRRERDREREILTLVSLARDKNWGLKGQHCPLGLSYPLHQTASCAYHDKACIWIITD